MVLRRILHLHFLNTHALTVGVRAAVMAADGRFVLVRHIDTPGWHFPGNGLVKDEFALDAVQREVEQEVGISLPSMPELHGVYFNKGVSRRDHILLLFARSDAHVP